MAKKEEKTAPALSEEDLKRLPPDERIKALRAIEERRRKELEEERKRVERELQEAESLIRQSEEELDVTVRREPDAKPRKEEHETRKKDESIDSLVAKEKVAAAQNVPQYKTGTEYLTDKLTGDYRIGGERERSDQALYQREKDKQYKTDAPSMHDISEGYTSPGGHHDGLSINILKEMYKR